MTILFLKDTENSSFYWAILFGFPAVSYSNEEMHEVKWKYFMTVCNQPFVEGFLRVKNGSTGLSIRKIKKVLDVLGQPRMRLKKILILLAFAYK